MRLTGDRLIVAASVLSTISAVFPGFLIGAVAVQVREEFDVSEAVYGWGLGGFFLAAAAGSILFGRLAQRIGGKRQVMGALVVCAAVQLAIAAVATSFWLIVALLAVGGLCNAANQTSVNLVLAQARLPRLGLAVSLKQSGMPTASLLCGLMVPIFALTVGWRWAYVFGACVTLVALALVRATPDPPRAAPRGRSTIPRRHLVLAAVTGTLLAFAAGSTNSWLVSGGVEAGLSEGIAGLVLSVGAAAGITVRLLFGFRMDNMATRPFLMVAALAFFGSFGLAGLALEMPAAHVLATLVAFGSGWAWPVFSNYGIVRTAADGAGAATGVTQMGVYVGVFCAPLVTGWLISEHGYPTMWLVVASVTVVGAAVAWSVRSAF